MPQYFRAFFDANLIAFYFIYGLAFFSLALSTLLASNPQIIVLSRFLAAFAFTQSLIEWSKVLALTGAHISDSIRLLLSVIAAFFLLEFGARSLGVPANRAWARQIPLGLGVVYVLGLIAVDSIVLPGHELANAASLARYGLYVPGYFIAAWVFFESSRRGALRQPASIRLAGRGIVLALLVEGILVGPLAPVASVSLQLDGVDWAENFLFGFPILIFQTAAAVTLAGSAVWIFWRLGMARERALAAAEKRNQELIREAERAATQHRYVFDHANDAIFIHDLAGHFIDVNQVACQRLGYTHAELVKIGINDIDDPATVARRGKDVDLSAFLETKTMIAQVGHRRKDGTIIPVELNARLIEYNGQPAILTVARDISERKRAEADIQQRSLELDRLYRQAEERADRIAVSNEIIRTISSGESIVEIFQTFAEQTRRLVPYSRMGIALIDPVAGTMTFQRRDLEDGIDAQPGLTYPIAGGPVEQIVQTKRPWLCPDVRLEDRFPQMAASLLELGLQSSIIMPILWEDQVLGTLNLHSASANAYGEKDVQTLEPIAGQLAIAIQNTNLQKQIQEMAIREERDRLGREMHDGLGQVIAYFRLKLGEVDELLRQREIDEARQVLSLMIEVSQNAYSEVREAILGLRATVTTGTGLEPVLREYLYRYQREWGIASELNFPEDAKTRISSSAEIQLLRIVQEALTNVRKHARAKCVRVRFEANDQQVLVAVEDDGCGFDVAQPRREHFGLQTMRERAESVGGTFEVNSERGRGTRIRVRLPYPATNGDGV